MAEYELIDAHGREVRISSPGKVIFPDIGVTKRDLVDYYVHLAGPVINQLRDRPTVLKRFPNGAAAEPFFQKRIPDTAPNWLTTTTVTFPSGRTARELLPNDAATLVWGVNLGVIDWNPWQARAADLEHPDELRVDLDPTPEASWDDVRQVALVAGEVLSDHGLTG
ncbi:MAG: ATP-dependent DNA ligase, partial [Solirubrobacteraceae bacterium]